MPMSHEVVPRWRRSGWWWRSWDRIDLDTKRECWRRIWTSRCIAESRSRFLPLKSRLRQLRKRRMSWRSIFIESTVQDEKFVGWGRDRAIRRYR